MKIGDKVRFLNEVGEGVVAGFRDKNTVLVRDDIGFEIPMLLKDVVVIEEPSKQTAPKTNPLAKAAVEPEKELEPCDRPVTFRAKPQEKAGGDRLNIYLAFVPVEEKEQTMDPLFEAYIVNDSNYFLSLLYMSDNGARWQARFQATVEPNQKLFIEDFRRSELNDLEHLCVQMMCFKQDRPFMLKPAFSVPVRLDPVRFYKLHTFQPSKFFKVDALVIDLVRE